MTQDETLKLAEQSGATVTDFINYDFGEDVVWVYPADLAEFAKLVEDKVTARYMQLFLDPENQPTQFGTATQEYREQEIKGERRSCVIVGCNACVDPSESVRVRQAISARGEA